MTYDSIFYIAIARLSCELFSLWPNPMLLEHSAVHRHRDGSAATMSLVSLPFRFCIPPLTSDVALCGNEDLLQSCRSAVKLVADLQPTIALVLERAFSGEAMYVNRRRVEKHSNNRVSCTLLALSLLPVSWSRPPAANRTLIDLQPCSQTL